MKRSLIILSAVVVTLSGCLDDKPSDKLASETIRQVANNDQSEGLEIVNFQRSNGQVDPDSANRYKVTYSYDLRLEKPFAEVVLANAKVLQTSWAANAKRETGAFFDATKLENNLTDMQVNMAVNQWVKNQGESFKTRRDTLLGDCSSCVAYWNSKDVPNEAQARRLALLSSWIYFEELGFKDSSKVGDSIPRRAWAFFSKTEKGWQPIN